MDLDQGGTPQQWERVYCGPSIGWVNRPTRTIKAITITGTYAIDLAINFVTINCNGAVNINLPSYATNASPGANPGLLVRNPIIITDIGGFAFANQYGIFPPAGKTIMGLASLTLGSNFGAYVLMPLDNGNYENITS